MPAFFMLSQSAIRILEEVGAILSVAQIVEAFADLAIALLLAGIAWHLFAILRKAHTLTERVQEEGEEILDDLEEARESAEEGASALATGAGIAAEVIADIAMNRKKPRRKKTR